MSSDFEISRPDGVKVDSGLSIPVLEFDDWTLIVESDNFYHISKPVSVQPTGISYH